MRNILILCGSILIAGGFFAWRGLQKPTVYGEFVGAPAVAVADLVERPKDFMGRTVSAEWKISQQCESMGCFFFFQSGTKTLRVELKDIAMTAPRREGHLARVEGQIVPFADGYQLYATGLEFK